MQGVAAGDEWRLECHRNIRENFPLGLGEGHMSLFGSFLSKMKIKEESFILSVFNCRDLVSSRWSFSNCQRLMFSHSSDKIK